MSTGMEMMMQKMLGFSADDIRAQMEKVGAETGAIIGEFRSRFDKLEGMLVIIAANQQAQYKALVDAGVIEPIPESRNPLQNGEKIDAENVEDSSHARIN